MKNRFAGFLALSFASLLWAGETKPAPTPSQNFSRLKQLVGTWTGTNSMHGQETPMTLDYSLIAGGSVVVEREFPGTPHEMMNVYTESTGPLCLTHYCALGNQPHMKLVRSTANSLSFEQVGSQGLKSKRETHMHALTLTFPDANSLTQTWVNYDNGKPSQSVEFHFTRSSSPQE